jgi:hypothetical protein
MRFDKKEPWDKLLFIPDRRLQSAELEEIQDVVSHVYENSFNYLYYYYYVTKLFSVTILEADSNKIKIKLSSGQVYINDKDFGSTFVDVEEQTFLLQPDIASQIGIKFSSEIYRSNSLRDPLTGGIYFGDIGADRLVVNYQITINEDSYPIVCVIPQGEARLPEINYYNNQKFYKDSDYYYSNFPQEILDYIYLRRFEEKGNYISSGLNIYQLTADSIGISAGKCYLNGKPKEVKNVYVSKINIYQEGIYNFYIDSNAKIVQDENTFIKQSNELFLLGTVIVTTERKIEINPSSSRAISQLSLLSAYEKSFLNTNKLSELYLIKNTINAKLGLQSIVDKIIVDNFDNLEGSNIYHTLFNASLDLEQKRLYPGQIKTSVQLNKSGVKVNQNVEINSINNFDDNAATIKTIAPLSSTTSHIFQQEVTDVLKVTDTRSSIFVTVSPSISLPNFKSKTSTVITNVKDLKGVVSLETATIQIDASGFNVAEDNIKIIFGNTRITTVSPRGDTQLGTLDNTLRANSAGVVSALITVPSNLPLQNYVVEVSSDRVSGNGLYTYIENVNIEQRRVLSNINGSVAQSFCVEKHITVKGLNLFFRKVPALFDSSLVLGKVYLVQMKGATPERCVLSCGDINYSNIFVSENGKDSSEILFDYPLTLIPSQYAIVIDLYQSSVEMFYATSGNASLNTPSLSANKLLTKGDLLIYENDSYKPISGSDLTFELISSTPNSYRSSIEFVVPSQENKIKKAQKYISEIIPTGTGIKYFYKDNNNWIEWDEEIELNYSQEELEMKIEFISARDKTPIIKNNNSFIILKSYRTRSSWISVNRKFEEFYSNIEVEFNSYLPPSTEIYVLFSSNLGEEWNAISLTNTELIDNNIPLYKNTYEILNLNRIVSFTDLNGNKFEKERRDLTLRIDFELNNEITSIPYISKLITNVY